MRNIVKTLKPQTSTERYIEASTKHTFKASLKHFIRCKPIVIYSENGFLTFKGWLVSVS